MRDYVDGCSGQLKARRTRKRVYDRTQPAVGEDEAPVNAPKWTTAGYKGSLKASVEKYTRRNVASSPEPLPQTAPSTAPVKAGPSTAPVKAGPSRTDDIFYLDESTLVGENVLDSDSSSKETDKEKKESGSSEDESDSSSSEESSSGDEEDDDKNTGKDKEKGSGASSSRKQMIAIKEKM